ncbi:MAG: (Fe-S)-binding protein [Deltaproteobacteria bacterium]|nr:MAG: (Fe-S)-binding protein [Deltaproteobacteria bacterium]
MRRWKKKLWAWSIFLWQALVVQPLRRLAHLGTTGEQRFLKSYAPEGLLPEPPERVGRRFDHDGCIHCGLCDATCDLLARVRRVEVPAVSALPVAWSRSMPEYPYVEPALRHFEACEACQACERMCPTGVPLLDLVQELRAWLQQEHAAGAVVPRGETSRGEGAQG